MAGFFSGGGDLRQGAVEFDEWLVETCTQCSPEEREVRLRQWDKVAPSARLVHPREEHLLPLMVSVGAAGDAPGTHTYSDEIMGLRVSGFQFGSGMAVQELL